MNPPMNWKNPQVRIVIFFKKKLTKIFCEKPTQFFF
jgi:hypothetical protein